MPVIYIDLYREKRGYYVGELSLITDKPKETEENSIMDDYILKLEESIRNRPHSWLWSHRRWKHKRPQTED
jgi:KDO2-lipid IV(A) lauroyltransferase